MTSLESQARYITRPALAMDALQKLEDGRLAVHTPRDPRTGATLLALDPLERIVSFSLDPRVIDHILRHRESRPAIRFLPRVLPRFPSLPL